MSWWERQYKRSRVGDATLGGDITIGGDLIVTGATSGIDHTDLDNIGTNTHAQIDTHVALTNEHIDWTSTSENFSTSGTLGVTGVTTVDDMTITGDITFTDTVFRITSDTADGSDNKILSLAAGGGADSSRAAYINLYGNEAAGSPGDAILEAGNVSGGEAKLRTGATDRLVIAQNGGITGTMYDWTTWTPTFGATGGGAWDSDGAGGTIVATWAYYQLRGKEVLMVINAVGVITGTVTGLTFTTPVSAHAFSAYGGACISQSSTANDTGLYDGTGVASVVVRRPHGLNFASQAGLKIAAVYRAS